MHNAPSIYIPTNALQNGHINSLHTKCCYVQVMTKMFPYCLPSGAGNFAAKCHHAPSPNISVLNFPPTDDIARELYTLMDIGFNKLVRCLPPYPLHPAPSRVLFSIIKFASTVNFRVAIVMDLKSGSFGG